MEDKKLLKEKSKFATNELVLCYDPDPIKARMLYDAKVLDVDLTKDDKGKKVCEYYIHFQGWNKSWDRWILEEQILKDTEADRNLQAKLLKEAIKPKKRKRKITKSEVPSDEKEENQPTEPSRNQLTESSKASLGVGGLEQEEEVKVIQLPPVSLDIPKTLANHLEDDCYNIKRGKKLIHLPRKPSINDIFYQYNEHCMKSTEQPEGRALSLTIVKELIDGLNTYINFFTNTLLLYNFEREQYRSFFPLQKVPQHLLSLHASTPPVTPLISPKLSTLASVEKSTESKNSSSSSSRSSSFSEDLPLSTTVRKRGRERKSLTEDHRRRRGESISDKQSTIDTGCSSLTRSPSLDCENHLITSRSSSVHRETRSSRSSSKTSVNTSVVKEEPMEMLTDEKPPMYPTDKNAEGIARPRRSRRSQKLPGTSGPSVSGQELQSLPMYPKPKLSTDIVKEFRKPLTIQTEFPKAEAGTIGDDRSFMMFPQRPETGETPADVYGVEHLLRLFVKLPVLLASSNIQQQKLDTILSYVGKFLNYLAKRNDLFTEDVYLESVI